MNSPISPKYYVPQSSEEIMQQIRECDTVIAQSNLELAKLGARFCIEAEVDKDNMPPLEKEFFSGQTFPITQQQLKPEDFIPWIKRQPDDRKLNMQHASFFPGDSCDRCGCLLVQWAQDNGWNGKIHAGFCQVEVAKNDAEWETCYFTNEQGGKLIHQLYSRKEMTFGEVKTFL